MERTLVDDEWSISFRSIDKCAALSAAIDSRLGSVCAYDVFKLMFICYQIAWMGQNEVTVYLEANTYDIDKLVDLTIYITARLKTSFHTYVVIEHTEKICDFY